MGLDESGHHSPDEAEAISADQPGDLRNPTPKQNGPFAVIAVILWASNDEDHGGSNAVTYSVNFLDATTWNDFVQLVERHNGIWGGCWCLGFHQELSKTSAADNRAEKERLVMEGRAHAALVYAADVCVGWCQFGRVAELPNIKYRKAYDEQITELPDWRITCFFVHREYRGRGVASTALGGVLDAIAQSGGGTVEAYPEDYNGREVSKSLPYMYNGLVSMFERHGFGRLFRLGKHHWAVRKVIESTPTLDEEHAAGQP